MESPRRGEIGINAIIGIAVGLLAGAAFIYVWTNYLPVDTQVIPTP